MSRLSSVLRHNRAPKGCLVPVQSDLHAYWRHEDQKRWAQLEAFPKKAPPNVEPASPSTQDVAQSGSPDGADGVQPPRRTATPNAPVVAPADHPVPSPPPIAQTLDEIAAFISKFLVCSDHQRTVLVLWIVHTYCFEYFPGTPYLEIFSPENQSGKTVCLRVLQLLCSRAWLPGGVTPARLISRIANSQPTLLLDNWHTILRASDDQSIIGFLNAGSVHHSHYPTQAAGQDSDKSIFCPKAFAGHGRLPASLADRCIPIALRRRKSKEEVWTFWRDIALGALRSLMEPLPAWTRENYSRLRVAAINILCSPSPAFSMRQHELAAPLLALAEAVGGKWPARARTALLRIFAASPAQPPSIGLQLLADIRDFFERAHDPPRIHTTPLLEYLNSLEERPWKNLGPNALRRILQNFPVGRSGSQRIGGRNFKGFTFQQFVESWESYLPHRLSPRSTQPNPSPNQVGTNETLVGTNEIQVGTKRHLGRHK